MVATGFLRLDIAGYGGLGITDKGRDLLRGKGAFRYREDTVAARPSAPSRETRGKEPEHPLSGDQTACSMCSRRCGCDWRRNGGCRPTSCFRTAR